MWVLVVSMTEKAEGKPTGPAEHWAQVCHHQTHCMCVCARAFVCVCVCVCGVRAGEV